MNYQQRLRLLKSIKKIAPIKYKNAVLSLRNSGNRTGAGFRLGALADTDAQVTVATTEIAANQSWFDKLLSSFPDLLKAGLLVKNQNDLNKINLELVKQGKPPLSSDAVGTVVNVGIAAETRKILVYTAVGLGVLLAVVLLRPKAK